MDLVLVGYLIRGIELGIILMIILLVNTSTIIQYLITLPIIQLGIIFNGILLIHILILLILQQIMEI